MFKTLLRSSRTFLGLSPSVAPITPLAPLAPIVVHVASKVLPPKPEESTQLGETSPAVCKLPGPARATVKLTSKPTVKPTVKSMAKTTAPVLAITKKKEILPRKYIGVYRIGSDNNIQYQVRIANRYYGLIKDQEEARKIHDLYTTVLIEEGLIPIETKTNWKKFDKSRPKEAENPEKIQKVLDWFKLHSTNHKASVYTGVRWIRSKYEEATWGFYLTSPDGTIITRKGYKNALSAALSYDTWVRDMKFSKEKKIKLLNFRTKKEYFTVDEAKSMEEDRLIGIKVTQIGKWYTFRGTIPIVASRLRARKYDTAMKAVSAYDRFVLEFWASKENPNLPYPPTTFAPTNYNYPLQEPPTPDEL